MNKDEHSYHLPPPLKPPSSPAHQTAPPTHPRKANIVPSSRHVICYNLRFSNHLVNSGGYPQKNLTSPRTPAIFDLPSGEAPKVTGWVGLSLLPPGSNSPRLFFTDPVTFGDRNRWIEPTPTPSKLRGENARSFHPARRPPPRSPRSADSLPPRSLLVVSTCPPSCFKPGIVDPIPSRLL